MEKYQGKQKNATYMYLTISIVSLSYCCFSILKTILEQMEKYQGKQKNATYMYLTISIVSLSYCFFSILKTILEQMEKYQEKLKNYEHDENMLLSRVVPDELQLKKHYQLQKVLSQFRRT